MNDALLVAGWVALLAVALAAVTAARRAGIAVTYLRDVIHIGAGLWPLAWPLWSTKAAPIAFALAGAAAAFVAPKRIRAAISDDDEKWLGVQLYGAVFALGTCVAFTVKPMPAAAALLALSLGDGIGGLIGRRFGKHFYKAPGGKRKSFEGSAAVALFAALGAMLVGATPLAGLVAALAEALAPAATDNAIVPLAVWLFLQGASS